MTEPGKPKPDDGDRRAVSAVMLLNAVMAGLAGLYASSRSIPLTVAGGVLAAVVARLDVPRRV